MKLLKPVRHTSIRTNKLALAAASFALAAPVFAGSTYEFLPNANTASPQPSGTANWNDVNSWVINGATGAAGKLPGLPSTGDIAGSATGATTIVNDSETVNDVRWANQASSSTVATLNGTAYKGQGQGTLEIDSGGNLTSQSTTGTSNGNILIGNSQGVNPPSGGSLIVTGGTLTTTSSTAITSDGSGPYVASLVIGNATSANGYPNSSVNISGGNVNIGNNFALGQGFTAAGSSTPAYPAIGTGTQSGGDVEITGAFIDGAKGIGSYTITGGTLAQNGTNGDANALGRDAFFVGQVNNGNGVGGQGTFTQSGSAVVKIANGLYIANQTNTTGTYTVSGGSLSIHGDISVGAAGAAGVSTAAAVTGQTNNKGEFAIVGNSAPTIFANHLTANTANSTLGFTVGSSAGTTLLDLSAGNGFDGSALLSAATNIDLDTASGFVPSSTDVYELLRATSISALPTLVLDGDAFDAATLSIRNNTDGTESLIATVPEPVSFATIGFAGSLLIARRRRQ